MPGEYQVYLHQAVLDVLEGAEYLQRIRVLDFCERLGRQPFQSGDFTERGEAGRDVQVSILGGLALVWWADHAVCEIKVVRVRLADA